MPDTSMKKPTILATHRFPEAVEKRLAADYEVLLPNHDGPRSKDDVLDLAEKCDGLLVAPGARCRADVINALPDSVKIIATFSVGYDHIDVPAAAGRRITVTNTPDVLTDATADIAMLLLLGASRRANEGMAMIRDDNWTGWVPRQLIGTQITGKRLGIYGMGRIGQAFAHRARAFGMEIHYHNRKPLGEAEAADAIYHDSLESLMSVSDVFSIHAPSTPETRYSINAAALAKLPDGAILINTGRGDLVVDDDVIDAAKSGKLSAIGLDVFDGEPNLHSGYRMLDNAFLLPHLGSATTETRNAMGFRALDNLDAFFAGQPCPDALT